MFVRHAEGFRQWLCEAQRILTFSNFDKNIA